MAANSDIHYRITADDRIVAVNDAWTAFAANNNGPTEVATTIGRSIWDSLADDTTVQLYQAIVQRVRNGGKAVRFSFRCDSPDRKRLLGMEISPAHAGAVDFRISTVAEESRETVALLADSTGPRSDELLTICSWCKSVRLPNNEWVQIENAVEVLGLFGGAALPYVTHGMCTSCFDTMNAALDDADLAEQGSITLGAFRTL